MPGLRALLPEIPKVRIRLAHAPYAVETYRPVLLGLNDLIKNHAKFHPNEPLLKIRQAAAVLRKTIGSEEDPVNLGRKPNRDGYIRPIAWDPQADCIIASTIEGYVISIEGTNLIEAAVFIPIIYAQIKQLITLEGIGQVELRVEGKKESWSHAASPLQIKINAPNLHHLSASVSDTIKASFADALRNRI